METDVEGNMQYSYALYYPIDASDEVVSTPFDGRDVCFRKPHLADRKVAASEVASSCACGAGA